MERSGECGGEQATLYLSVRPALLDEEVSLIHNGRVSHHGHESDYSQFQKD